MNLLDIKINQATLIRIPVAVEKPAAIQHEGRGGVAAVASASSASGGHGKKKKKMKAKKSAKPSKGNVSLSMSGVKPVKASSLLLMVMLDLLLRFW